MTLLVVIILLIFFLMSNTPLMWIRQVASKGSLHHGAQGLWSALHLKVTRYPIMFQNELYSPPADESWHLNVISFIPHGEQKLCSA